MANARNTVPIAIAGGGIGGLAAALALARHGFRSLVLEQAREFGEVGVGLQMAPNAVSVLDALGVGVAAKKHALLIERFLMMDAVTGEEVANIPCDERFEKRFGNPYAVAHRAHIHGPLLEACRSHDLVELRTNAQVTTFDFENPLVSVLLQSGERIPAVGLIGADGVYSNVRKLIIKDGDPLPVGAIVFRATIPASEMPKDLQHPYPVFWAGPDWHVIYYPMNDWSMFNLGCTVVTGQSTLCEPEDFAPLMVLPYFKQACEIPARVLERVKDLLY
jgi:3-hydroxybenzoate 6-monooxygenase